MAWEVELAKQFKKRDNNSRIGNIVGKVAADLPDIKVIILDGNAILTKDELYCCNSLLIGYTREAAITGNIKFNTNTAEGGIEPHTHAVNVNTLNEQTCTITYTNGLTIGDYVLLQHSEDESKWFIIDKITKL
ncbi:DUF2577 family protein [Anaerovorax odorimutans]|uniref:DUF2577 family protein n=1 Tax=Anaerovorax odorimutans TaxID=109327 RepID=UPI00041AFB44|nr:DUF2577 family protein [Anaerovorax odorimutans]